MRYISVILFGIAAALLGWVLYCSVSDAIEGLRIQLSWKPLPGAYAARVTGFADRGGIRAKATAPIVEIRFADGATRTFTSPRSGSFHLLSRGDEVRVLSHTVQFAGQPIEVFEVQSAFELWIKDLLCALGLLCVVLGIPLWVYRPLRFRR